MGPSNSTYLSKIAIFRFHDCGRKSYFLVGSDSNGLFDAWQVSHLQLSSRVHSLCGLLEGGFPESAEFSSTNPLKRSDLWENPAMMIWKSSTEITMHQNWVWSKSPRFFVSSGVLYIYIAFRCGWNISQKLDVHINSSYKTQYCHKKKRTAPHFLLLSAMWFSPPNGLMFGAKFHDLQEFCTWKKPVAASIVTTFLFARSVLKLGVNTGTSC